MPGRSWSYAVGHVRLWGGWGTDADIYRLISQRDAHVSLAYAAMAQSVESTRGKRKYVDGGYMSVFDKRSSNGQKCFWRCDNKHHGCPARSLHFSTNEKYAS